MHLGMIRITNRCYKLSASWLNNNQGHQPIDISSEDFNDQFTTRQGQAGTTSVSLYVLEEQRITNHRGGLDMHSDLLGSKGSTLQRFIPQYRYDFTNYV